MRTEIVRNDDGTLGVHLSYHTVMGMEVPATDSWTPISALMIERVWQEVIVNALDSGELMLWVNNWQGDVCISDVELEGLPSFEFTFWRE